MLIDVDKLAMQDMINKINNLDKENKELRITNTFLKDRYDAVCQTLHTILMLNQKEHDNKDWKLCSSLVCVTSNEVLKKLRIK